MAATLKMLYDLKSEAATQLSTDQVIPAIINGTGTLAGQYSPTTTYHKGDKTLYIDANGVIHTLECIADLTTGDPITLADWEEYSILDEIDKLKGNYIIPSSTQPDSKFNNTWLKTESTDDDGIIHGTLKYNTTVGSKTNTYKTFYAKSSLTDIAINSFSAVSDLDNIPTTNYTTGTLDDLLQNLDAKVRKLDRDKLNASEVTSTATANKVLSLDANKILQATASKAIYDENGSKLTSYIKGLTIAGKTITYTMGDGSTDVLTTQDTQVTNTLATRTKAYITATTSAVTSTGTQVFDTGVYLDITAGSLVATTFYGNLTGLALSATQDAKGRNIANTYAVYSDMWDANGHLTSPTGGWKIWIVNT